MRYAEVAVNVPVRSGQPAEENTQPRLTFHYHIPPALDVRPGHLVWVSFGAQHVQGIVVALSDESPVEETKPILAIAEAEPYLPPSHLALINWLADYYLCPIADAAFSLLPPGIEQRAVVIVSAVPDPLPAHIDGLNEAQRALWELVQRRGRLSVDEIRRELKTPGTQNLVDQLFRRKLVTKEREIERPKVRPKMVRTTWLVVDVEQVQAEIDRLHEPRLRRARVLRALLAAGAPLPRRELRRQANASSDAIDSLVEQGLVAESDDLLNLAVDGDAAAQAAGELEAAPTGGQAGILSILAQQRLPVELGELYKLTGTSFQQIKALADKGLLSIEEREVRRDPLAHRAIAATLPPPLTVDQAAVYRAIQDELLKLPGVSTAAGAERPAPVLLHGVTGSGKTEVYLRAVKDVLALGRQAIIMVPEIALTPQTIHRFASRFAGNVAVLHSKLSLGEHFDEWRRIRDGLVDVVVGSRSSVFAPLPRLGLIVIDEEHEWTYKQTDVAPRYHAREVALKLAELTGALVIMGSATPDLVSYQRARDGEFRLLELKERLAVRSEPAETPQLSDGDELAALPEAPSTTRASLRQLAAPPSPDVEEDDDWAAMKSASRSTLPLSTPPPRVPVPQAPAAPAAAAGPVVTISALPAVELVDMRSELRAGNTSIFSRSLFDAITVALAARQQIILFLNRRGTATFVMCRSCGHVLRCKSCDAPLSYHGAEDDLVCHQCNRRYLALDICPQCWSKRIKFFGIGTQKVEEEMRRLFPEARLLRWDRDVTGGKDAHEAILDQFINHRADVLIGTQMVAKGLDMPLVTLVGVISADTILHLPDFRSGERTFQLLTQVAGRAGRSTLGGRAIVQTYTPEHYAIQAASRHDYAAFAGQETAFRAQKGYPPFSQLALLLYQHSSKEKAQHEAERVHQALRLRIQQQGIADTALIGPAPSFFERLRGRYRWHILVRSSDVHRLLDGYSFPAGWSVDVDPAMVL